MAYANATAPRDKGRADGKLFSFPMADGSSTAVKIYKGSIVYGISGYAKWGGDNASAPFLGVAGETKENTGAAAAANILIEPVGVWSFIFGPGDAAADDLFKEVYLDIGASGNPMTVTTVAPGSHGCKVGRIVEIVSATEVRVDINGYALVVAAAAS